jgi:hypothetical protein
MITLLQRMVADDVLTRVLGVLWGMAMGAVAIGSVAASLVVTAIGPRAAFAAVGVILPLLVLVSYHRLVEIDTTAVPTLGLDLIDRCRRATWSFAKAMPATGSTSSATAPSVSMREACASPPATGTTSVRSRCCATLTDQRPSPQPPMRICMPCNVSSFLLR